MKDAYMAIVILSACFAVILLILTYLAYGSRLYKLIDKVCSSFNAKGEEDKTANRNSLIQYDTYTMTVKENLICVIYAGAAMFTVGYIFYRSILLSMLLIPIAFLYLRLHKKKIIKRRKEELNLQFREALYSISSSLSAGKSIETAFRDAYKELYIQYPDPDTLILVELENINKRIEMNETIEEALSDFADRSALEDIINFTDVFSICKRTGGNLVQVVKNTAEIISEKIDIKQEINVLLTEKKLEHKVLNLMPIFIVLLLSTSAEEFMLPVFTEPIGKAAMTFSLLLFSAAFLISGKIMDIEV